jgi:predicted nucleotidyltransferase component of viral defense system
VKKLSAKSIRAKLLHISKKENISFQLIIIRYFQERLLYRLSISQFNENFCLKGGVLLYMLNEKKSRPTIDIDFLAINTQNDQNYIKYVFSEICKINPGKDAVLFDYQNIVVEDILKQANYNGVRVTTVGYLDTIKQRIQIDIGFGDKVHPEPLMVNYPVILEMEYPVIQAYSIYSVIAEKFEAMIQLSEVNSGMKDFYDIYIILTNKKIEEKELEEAVITTFRTRKTICTKNPSIFQNDFFTDKSRLTQWEAFKKKTKITEDLTFEEVLRKIRLELEPIYSRLL